MQWPWPSEGAAASSDDPGDASEHRGHQETEQVLHVLERQQRSIDAIKLQTSVLPRLEEEMLKIASDLKAQF